MSDGVISHLNAWASLWAGGMTRACWQGGLFLLILWGVCRLFPRLPASVRCGLWWIGCVKLLIGLIWVRPVTLGVLPAPSAAYTPPAAAVGAPSMSAGAFRMPILNTGTWQTPALSGDFGHGPHPASVAVLPDRIASVSPPSPSLLPAVYLLGLWLLGLALCLAVKARSFLAVRRLLRAVQPSDQAVQEEAQVVAAALRVRSVPAILTTDRVRSPLLVGLIRPVILLPSGEKDRLAGLELRLALAHELAHLRRLDLWLGLAPALTRLLFFFHPLVWLAGHEFALCREEACDGMTLHATAAPVDRYGELLLKFVAGDRFRMAAGLGVGSSFRNLHRRLTMLQYFTPTSGRGAWKSLSLCVLGALIGLIPWSLVGAQSSEDPLAGNPLLAQRVAITAEGVPVSDLLALLSQKTGVLLKADSYVADDKVILFGPPRPLKDVMADTAALFHDLWLHGKSEDGKDVYRLVRDARAREYEDNLARTTIDRMLAQLDAYIKAANETPEQLAKRPKDDPIRLRLQWDSNRYAARFAGLLSPEQREYLLLNKNLNFPFDTLTPAQQFTLRQTYDDVMTAVEKVNSNFHRPATGPVGLEENGVKFAVQTAGDNTSSGSLTVFLIFDLPGIHMGAEVAPIQSRNQWLLPPHGDPYIGKPVSRSAVLPARDAIQEAEALAQATWTDRLRKLAEQSGTPIIADYYRSKPVARPLEDPFPAAPAGTPTAALDHFCKPDGYLWWTRGKTLLFRKRNWYTQRQYEVPDRWILDLAQHLKSEGDVPTISDVLRLSELTTAQMAGMRMSGVRNASPDAPEIGVSTDQFFLAGLTELLALLKETPAGSGTGRAAPVSSFSPILDLRYNDLTPHQRSLLPGFVQGQSASFSSTERQVNTQLTYPGGVTKPATITEGGLEHFRCTVTSRKPDAPDAEGLDVMISYGFGMFMHAYALRLPLSLYDDRRATTKIERLP